MTVLSLVSVAKSFCSLAIWASSWSDVMLFGEKDPWDAKSDRRAAETG